jgi:hypothetical protein
MTTVHPTGQAGGFPFFHKIRKNFRGKLFVFPEWISKILEERLKK